MSAKTAEKHKLPSFNAEEMPSEHQPPFDPEFGVDEQLKSLRWQIIVGYLLHVPMGYLFAAGLRLWGGYKIENHREIRKRFREIVKDDRPLIICSNHMTYIDSALILWALGPVWWYAIHYKKFSWNLPAGDHFKKKWIHRVVAYLFKCIFIHRDGSMEHKNAVLNTCLYLLKKGHLLTLFPEGRRSRTGRIDLTKRTYGLGKLLNNLDQGRVLCIHIRSEKQKTYTAYPPRGSHFRMQMEVITPKTQHSGREAYADYVDQVTSKIKTFEDRYFESIGQSANAPT